MECQILRKNIKTTNLLTLFAGINNQITRICPFLIITYN
ncbi:hypothetical protein T11_12175 [Trichinella zimbabwensis]|uniref:Uncharacterized protein n=1 Tax=Trichinella zimbabwensis TaxID=268475 RepID=A0A0V1G6W4_9BILA|nr:hypothetical protein T11_12175 [Trichinella zimbabwensis]